MFLLPEAAFLTAGPKGPEWFLGHWASLACTFSCRPPVSRYLGFLPKPLSFQQPPLHGGHLIPPGYSLSLNSFLKRANLALSCKPYQTHRNSGTLGVEAFLKAPVSPRLSAQGASHLQFVCIPLVVSQMPVPVSLKSTGCVEFSKWSSPSVPSFGRR